MLPEALAKILPTNSISTNSQSYDDDFRSAPIITLPRRIKQTEVTRPIQPNHATNLTQLPQS